MTSYARYCIINMKVNIIGVTHPLHYTDATQGKVLH